MELPVLLISRQLFNVGLSLLWLHIFEATAMLAVESSVPTKSLVNQEHRLESAFQIIRVHLSAF